MTQIQHDPPRPHAPGPRDRLGARNLVRFATDQLAWLRELADRYGDVVELRMFGKPWFLVVHPTDIEDVMVKHARVMGRDAYTIVLQRALGLGLLTSDGDLWKRQRKLMSSAFVPKRIQGYADAMVRVTSAGLGAWRDGEVVTLHQEMSRVTMEVAADVLFGAGVSRRDTETVRDAMEIINEFFANSPEAIARVPEWFPTPRNRRMTRAVRQIDELIFRIIAERRRGPARDDFLGVLLSAQDDDGATMSDRQLRDEAVTLFLAGHETTALLLAHTLFLLSKHPDVERRLHAEIAGVLGGRAPVAADVKALPYLERVLKESMRLYPPAWTTGREANEDVVIGGTRVPRGAQILLSQWVVHRDPRWFPNPEGFDPDRWSDERAAGLPKFAYFPFGGGPRVCIGNHFAMMEATMMLSLIVRDWRVELLPGQTLVLKPSVTLRQRGPGLRVRLVERARHELGPRRSPALS
ncbi:MAG: cytochrome P450 [Polyangiaceae bacterium]|nr:cytochrome P450 [Polyangiaceae bacterium]